MELIGTFASDEEEGPVSSHTRESRIALVRDAKKQAGALHARNRRFPPIQDWRAATIASARHTSFMNNQTTLITGASSGIGLHLAHEFARHGHPLVLVAPVESELEEIAAHMRTAHGVDAHVIAKDLERPEAAQEIFDHLGRSGISTDILVNNAGHGQKGKFWEIPLERDLSMLRLNIEAVVRLTKLFLPLLIVRKGRILNTASVAGFEPGPGLAVYHATKAFVLSLSESLATELDDTGVTVTALCPGPTDTDFFPKANMTETVAFQKANLMAPQDVASAGYKALMSGTRVVVTGAANKAMVFSRHLIPESAQAMMNEKLYEDVDPEEHQRERGDVERKASAKADDALV